MKNQSIQKYVWLIWLGITLSVYGADEGGWNMWTSSESMSQLPKNFRSFYSQPELTQDQLAEIEIKGTAYQNKLKAERAAQAKIQAEQAELARRQAQREKDLADNQERAEQEKIKAEQRRKSQREKSLQFKAQLKKKKKREEEQRAEQALAEELDVAVEQNIEDYLVEIQKRKQVLKQTTKNPRNYTNVIGLVRQQSGSQDDIDAIIKAYDDAIDFDLEVQSRQFSQGFIIENNFWEQFFTTLYTMVQGSEIEQFYEPGRTILQGYINELLDDSIHAIPKNYYAAIQRYSPEVTTFIRVMLTKICAKERVLINKSILQKDLSRDLTTIALKNLKELEKMLKFINS